MAAKRGRPAWKRAVKPGWMLGIPLTAIHTYNAARAAGTKHTSALEEAAQAVRSRYPKIKFSVTELKRILAKSQPRGYDEAINVTESFAPGEGGTRRRVLTMSVGARSGHQRSNRKQPKKDRLVTN